jgi:hypothetical protein
VSFWQSDAKGGASMKYGLLMFAADYAIRVDDLAREAEARGF